MTKDEATLILGLTKTATLKEIKSAYRTRVKAVHPDKNPNSGAREMFQLVHEAYTTLIKAHETERRAQRDATKAKARREAATQKKTIKAIKEEGMKQWTEGWNMSAVSVVFWQEQYETIEDLIWSDIRKYLGIFHPYDMYPVDHWPLQEKIKMEKRLSTMVNEEITRTIEHSDGWKSRRILEIAAGIAGWNFVLEIERNPNFTTRQLFLFKDMMQFLTHETWELLIKNNDFWYIPGAFIIN